MNKGIEKLLEMIESISQAMVKMQKVIGDLVTSNLDIRRRLDELESRDGDEG